MKVFLPVLAVSLIVLRAASAGAGDLPRSLGGDGLGLGIHSALPVSLLPTRDARLPSKGTADLVDSPAVMAPIGSSAIASLAEHMQGFHAANHPFAVTPLPTGVPPMMIH